MAKQIKFTSHSSKVGMFKIGREASANISRVEGLIIPKDMEMTFRSFDKRGLSIEARRNALMGKYGKKTG